MQNALGLPPNNSFKPKPLRYGKNMAEKACHVFTCATRFGLTQALAHMKWFVAALAISLASCSSADETAAKCKTDLQAADEAELALRAAQDQEATPRADDKGKAPSQLAQEAAAGTSTPCTQESSIPNAREIPQIN